MAVVGSRVAHAVEQEIGGDRTDLLLGLGDRGQRRRGEGGELKDINGNAHSCIVDALSTMVVDGTQLKVIGWYDNEWGFSCKVLDSIASMKQVNG